MRCRASPKPHTYGALIADVEADDFVVENGGRQLTLYLDDVVFSTARRVVVARLDVRTSWRLSSGLALLRWLRLMVWRSRRWVRRQIQGVLRVLGDRLGHHEVGGRLRLRRHPYTHVLLPAARGLVPRRQSRRRVASP